MWRPGSGPVQSGNRPWYLHPVDLVLLHYCEPVRWRKHTTKHMSIPHYTSQRTVPGNSLELDAGRRVVRGRPDGLDFCLFGATGVTHC